MDLITPYLEAGHMGVKAGKGFYNYPNPAYAALEYLGVRDPSVANNYALLSSALINAGFELAVSEIASPEIIDKAWTLSIKTPLGPSALLQALGAKGYLKRLYLQTSEGWFDDGLEIPVKAYLAAGIV